jgi:hypothetical protein
MNSTLAEKKCNCPHNELLTQIFRSAERHLALLGTGRVGLMNIMLVSVTQRTRELAFKRR